jgi:putative membrane protein
VDSIAASLSTLPSFIAYFCGAGALTTVFLMLYSRLTPEQEIALIRSGNIAAAIALAGALLGFVVPLASVIAHSARILDLILWGVVALLIQLAGFLVARAMFPGLPKAIVEGQISEAVFLAGLSLALGIIDAACMAG